MSKALNVVVVGFLATVLGCDDGSTDAAAVTLSDGGEPVVPADGGSGEDDAGAAERDAGPTGHDSGVVAPDAGTAVDDAGHSAGDAGSPGPIDAGMLDSGVMEPLDSGTPGVHDAGTSAGDGGSTEPSVDAFSLVTYNVAGLPAWLSPSDPVAHMPQIGPFLNAYDIALVQEDYWFHDELVAGITLPFQSAPEYAAPTLLQMGDGLNRFGTLEFGVHTRFDWEECGGFTDACEMDCFTNKGFTFSPVNVGAGRTVHLYNLHMDAGTCDEDFVARQAQADQLAAEIATRSVGHAVIIAGDTNLNLNRPIDVGILDAFVAATGTEIACRVTGCTNESIDRVLFRSGDDVALSVQSRERPSHFVTADGTKLSDHTPTVVHFDITAL